MRISDSCIMDFTICTIKGKFGYPAPPIIVKLQHRVTIWIISTVPFCIEITYFKGIFPEILILAFYARITVRTCFRQLVIVHKRVGNSLGAFIHRHSDIRLTDSFIFFRDVILCYTDLFIRIRVIFRKDYSIFRLSLL